MVQSEGPEQEL
jgi:hypothetical protein